MTRPTVSRPVSLAAAFALVIAFAAPAMAGTRSVISSAGGARAAGPAQAPRRVCLFPTVTGDPVVTGSMLGKRVCRTKAEWESRGVIFQTK